MRAITGRARLRRKCCIERSGDGDKEEGGQGRRGGSALMD